MAKKRRTDAPKKPDAREPKSYDSLAAAAAGMGKPLALLKRLKRAGAAGFRGSRVYPADVEAYLAAHPDLQLTVAEDKTTLEAQILAIKLEQAKLDLENTRNLWILKTDVEGWLLARTERVRSLLCHHLKNVLPPKLVGLQVPEMAARMEPLITEIIDALRDLSPTANE